MPFAPLPRSFSARVQQTARAGGLVLDLGCGDGGLVRRLRGAGVPAFGMDLAPPALGIVADLRGDARQAPVAQASVDVLIAANLLRHLLVPDSRGRFLDHWLTLLRPAGCVYIFEDEPDHSSPAAANYRDLQRFLAGLSPGRRGDLLPWGAFQSLVQRRPTIVLAAGGCRQNRRPAHASAALAMLQACTGTPSGEPARLAASLRKHGLAYGRFWWACLQASG